MTASVSFTALGELFDAAPPITVIVISAVVVAVPSDNVYVKVSVTVAPSLSPAMSD